MLEKTPKNREFRFVLITLILVFGALISYKLRNYMSGFLGACTLYALLRVQMIWLTEKLKLKKGLSATLIVLESFFFFLIPITGMVFLGINVAQNINIDFEGIRDSILIFIEDIETRFNISIFNAENIASSIPKWSGDIVGTVAESTYSMVINSFIIVFVLYFMLVNYKDFEITIREILPFSSINKQKFLSESKSPIAISQSNPNISTISKPPSAAIIKSLLFVKSEGRYNGALPLVTIIALILSSLSLYFEYIIIDIVLFRNN